MAWSLGTVGGRLLRTRSLVRAPIWCYRHGLGACFGTGLLMLEHTGRRSGQPRFVVLEVVTRPDPGTWLVASGFGERSQWLRNVRAEPLVRVSTGRRRDVPATARVLGPEESRAALAAYAEAHPRRWRLLRQTVEQGLGTPAGQMPLVVLETRT